MYENDEYFVCNLLNNTSRSGTDLPSAIHLADTTNTNNGSAELTTFACCNFYYTFLAHDERLNANTEIVHPNETLPSAPSEGENMVYNDDSNRAAAVDDLLRYYLE